VSACMITDPAVTIRDILVNRQTDSHGRAHTETPSDLLLLPDRCQLRLSNIAPR